MSLALLIREITLFLQPLANAVSDDEELARLWRSIGHELQATEASEIVAAIAPEISALEDAFAQASQGRIDIPAASMIARSMATVLTSLGERTGAASGSGAPPSEIYDDIFSWLLRVYLGTRLPFVEALLEALGVLVEPNAPQAAGAAALPGSARVIFVWTRLTEFVQDTEQWAGDVYGWGRKNAGAPAFDQVLVMSRIAKLVETLQLAVTHLRNLSSADSAALLGPGAPTDALRIDLPVHQIGLADLDADAELLFDAELGISLLPFADPHDRADSGLAVAPYVVGSTFSIDEQLDEGVELAVAVDAASQVGNLPLLAITPAGARALSLSTSGELVPSAGAHFAFEATLTLHGRAGQAWVLGSPSGPRVQSRGLLLSARLRPPADFISSIAIQSVEIVVDLSADDLLGSLLSSPVRIPIGDVELGWSSQRGGFIGATFTGDGLNLKRSFVPHLAAGPVDIQRVNVALELTSPPSGGLSVRASADIEPVLSIGPVRLMVTGLGGVVALDLSADSSKNALLVDLVAPSGAAIEIDSALVSGDGFIAYDPMSGRYSGMFDLQAGQLGIHAIGLLDTRLPGGASGYALLIALRATFPAIQVGFGFALTAVGGLLAVNRRVDVDALRARFASGTAGRILAPEDPIRNAPALFTDLDAVFPVAPGVIVIGPTAQLVWAKLVRFDVGVFIELPGPSRIVVLGSARAVIEGGGRVYLMIRVDIVGVIDLERRLAEFDAVVVDSQLLEVLDLTGGAAFRLSWGDQPYAVLTLGGFHPAYNPEPLVFPRSLTRLAMVRGHPKDRLYLRFEGYFAVTSNTLQFGAAVEAVINAGNWNIQGIVAFDALIHFEPFHFAVDIRASVRVRYKTHSVGSLTLSGSLAGPGPVVLRAKVCIELLFFDICFSDTFTLGSSTPPPAATVTSALDALLTELGNPATLRTSDTTDRYVALRPPPQGSTGPVLSPVGQLIWSQRRAPLGLLLQRIAGTPLGTPQQVDATSPDGSTAELDWFAPGSFAELTDDQALTRRGFERLTGGLRLGHTGLTDGPASQATGLTIRQIRLPAKEQTTPTLTTFPIWVVTAAARAQGVAPGTEPVTPLIGVSEESWTITDTVTGLTHTGLTAAQAHQLATLAPATARPVATPAPDRLPHLAF